MVPKIVGKPPKWMVKIMENPIKIDDLGVPLFFGNTHLLDLFLFCRSDRQNDERNLTPCICCFFLTRDVKATKSAKYSSLASQTSRPLNE